MDNCIKKTVHCPLYNQDEVLYVYLIGDAILANICDNGHDCKKCADCTTNAVADITKDDFRNNGVTFPCW